MADRVERRLAAIVAADVVGYSRLIGGDEPGTIAAVRALQTETLVPILRDYGGRLVKTMGDGFLIEFASVVAGVEAATSLQKVVEHRAADAPEEKRLRLRIGIHVGDVVIDGDDIFGEGVNIAARVEPLAEPGGVGISDDAYRQVRDRVDLQWFDGGEHAVKNIARPIRVWHWTEAPDPERAAGQIRAPGGTVATPQLQVPDMPSVAVLPFDNMSGDADQVHFADGMTEDLITDLSKISGLFVVARNSTFAFRGQAVDIPTFARQLGVRHVVEGSVRKVGQRVRINVQLIDATTGRHVWADRYDGSLEDVFELQDDVCSKVVSALSVQLTQDEASRLRQVHTHNVDAYELFVQAKATPYPPIPERIAAARAMFERVVEMDPEFAGGYAGLSWLIGFGALWGHADRVALARTAEEQALKAISVDESFGWSHSALALAWMVQRRYDDATAASNRALALLPNDADAQAFHGLVLSFTKDRSAALAAVERAIRLSPHFINGPYLNMRSHILFLSGDFEATIASHRENVARGGPVGPPAYCWAAASYHAVGDTDAARRCVAELADRFPQFRLEGWSFLDVLATPDERTRVHELMRRAGIRDKR